MENPGTQQKKTFGVHEREEHRKQQRVHNSLGALLSGIGTAGSKPSEDCPSRNNSDAGQPPKVQNSSDQQNKVGFPSNQVQINHRNNFEDMSGDTVSAKSEFGWSAANSSMGFSSSNLGGSTDTNSRRHANEGADGDSSKKDKMQDLMSLEFESWTETRMLNDDHDNEWFVHENKKLAELYGEGIITAKYTDQGGLSYYCELCFATMNAKKPLEMHCSGMKHLKKKDIYEKNKASGKENPLVERRKILETSEKAPPPPRGSSDRGRQEHERSRGRSPVGRSRSPLGRSRSPLGRARSPLGHSRSPPSYGRDAYRRDRSYPYGYDRERDPYHRSIERDPYGRERERVDPSDRSDPYYDAYRDDYRGHPGDHRDERYHADEYSRFAGDYRDAPRYPDAYRDDKLPYPDDRRRYVEDYAYRSRDHSTQSRFSDDHAQSTLDTSDLYAPLHSPRSRFDDSLDRPHSSSSLPRRHGDRSPYSSERMRTAGDRLARLPSPPPAKPPPPVISGRPAPPVISANSSEDSQNLAGGPAASLLAKLAQCTVKNESDAELASNVIDLMLKSLKQYNEKIGEKSVAELMEQAEVKLGTAKAIRKVNKKTAPISVAAADPVSIAMETLRRAAAEKLPDLASAGPPVYKYF